MDVRSFLSLGILAQYYPSPQYYIQFVTDIEAKTKMLAAYVSTDLELFKSGYASFTNPVESLYLGSRKGLKVFEDLFALMEVTDCPDLFYIPGFWRKVGNRLRRILNSGRSVAKK